MTVCVFIQTCYIITKESYVYVYVYIHVVLRNTKSLRSVSSRNSSGLAVIWQLGRMWRGMGQRWPD